MAGLVQSEQVTTLDWLFPTTGATDYVGYSANGSSETGSLARTNIGATGWAAATAATPSVKSNANTLTSAAATGAVTVTHTAIFAGAAGAQRTDWQAVAASKTLAIGDKAEWAPGDLDVTLD